MQKHGQVVDLSASWLVSRETNVFVRANSCEKMWDCVIFKEIHLLLFKIWRCNAVTMAKTGVTRVIGCL